MLEPSHAAGVHGVKQFAKCLVTARYGFWLRASGGENRKRILDRRGHASDSMKRCCASAHRLLQSSVKIRIVRQPVTHMRQTEMNVARFVGLRATREFRRGLIRRMTLDET